MERGWPFLQGHTNNNVGRRKKTSGKKASSSTGSGSGSGSDELPVSHIIPASSVSAAETSLSGESDAEMIIVDDIIFNAPCDSIYAEDDNNNVIDIEEAEVIFPKNAEVIPPTPTPDT